MYVTARRVRGQEGKGEVMRGCERSTHSQTTAPRCQETATGGMTPARDAWLDLGWPGLGFDAEAELIFLFLLDDDSGGDHHHEALGGAADADVLEQAADV